MKKYVIQVLLELWRRMFLQKNQRHFTNFGWCVDRDYINARSL